MSTQPAEPVIDRIIQVIQQEREFLLLTHISPDGDAVGSLLALGRVLTALGKVCCLFSPGERPPEYLFLEAPGEISPSLPDREEWEVIFMLDTPCPSRLPSSLSGEIPSCRQLINIDHHGSNSIAGDLNWIDPGASSVGEMLYCLFDRAGYVLSAEVATPLYAAILTDTGSFRFPNAMPRSLRVAARLVELGADPAYVADHIYASHSPQKYRLLGEALDTLRVCCSGRVAFMSVTPAMLRKAGVSIVEADGFVNFPRKLKGVEVAALFKQERNGESVKVSLRSRSKQIDVARVAAEFGGGGHPTAAGCSVAGSMKLTQEKVLKAVAEELARADTTAAQSTTGQFFAEG